MTNKPRKKRSVIRRVLLLVVSVYLLYSLGDLQVQLINQRKEYNELNEQKKVMEQKISELERLLEDGTEADIIEKAARERLGYVYADEQVFVDISGNWFSGKIEGETQALMQLTVGEIVEGKVTGITNFGVFVDLGENQTWN